MKRQTYVLVCWDTETTGPNPAQDGVVQLGAIVVERGQGKGAYLRDLPLEIRVLADVLLNPGMPINPNAAQVHGITNEMVKDEQRDVDVLNEFLDELENLRPVVLATHNGAAFDRPIVERITGRKMDFPHIDTYLVATRLVEGTTNHKLGTLVTELGLGSDEGAHDAVADVKMVAKLVGYFIDVLSDQKYLGRQRWTWEDLAAWCEEPMVHEYVNIGKHAGKHWKDVPAHYINWMCANFESPLIDLEASVYHWHGKVFKRGRLYRDKLPASA